MVSFINTHFPFGVSLGLLYRLRLIIQCADVAKLFLIKTVVKPLVSTTGSVKNLIEQADEIPFYSWGYGRAYTEGGKVSVLRDGYIDNCADGPDVDYYDRDELASLIGDRYDAKYPGSSSCLGPVRSRCPIGPFRSISVTWSAPSCLVLRVRTE